MSDKNQENASESSPLIVGITNDSDTCEEIGGCSGTIVCDPRRWLHKYFVLIIMCFLSFGSYFCYDNPAALETRMDKDMHINTSAFMRLYAWYSWPNVVLCWFGGALIDRVLGLRFGAILFASLVTLGQIIFASGAYFNHFWLMEIGRFVFGLGGESLCVAQNTYAVSWFQGSALNTVFGLQLSFSRVGSTVNMNVMQPLYSALERAMPTSPGYRVLGVALGIAALFCIFSLFCSILMAYFDKRAARICNKETANASDPMSLKDMVNFRPSIWILCVICVGYYVTIFPFIGLGQLFFEKKFNMSSSAASMVDSLVYIISAFASPVFGLLIDRTGRNIFWLLFGVMVTLACHATLCLTSLNPFVPMSIMGLAYSLVASALWPMVAYIVPTNQLGTAYGLMQSVQNLGLAIVSILAGLIVDKYGYIALEWFFISWLIGSTLACLLLYIVDKVRDNGILNRSSKQRIEAAANDNYSVIN